MSVSDSVIKPIVSTIAAALIVCIAMPPTGASATTISQAEALCNKSPTCKPILRGDDGNIYCARQPDHSCIVVVCPTKGPCRIFRKAPEGSGAQPLTAAGAKEILERKKPLKGTTKGVLQVLENKQH